MKLLILVAFAALTSAQDFATTRQCQPEFNNLEDNDGAAGILRFDVAADEIGFFVNDFEFVADLTGDFIVTSVDFYDGSIFDEESQVVASLVDEDDIKTVSTISDERFALGLSSTFEVLPMTTAGVEILFEGNALLCRYSETDNVDDNEINGMENGDIVRRWGALSVSAGQAIGQDVVDDVVFHGGVCITTLGVGTLSVASVNLTAEEVVVGIDEELIISEGTAEGSVQFDDSAFQLTFTVDYRDLSSPATEVALHGPALRGETTAIPQVIADQIDLDTEGTASLTLPLTINSLQAIDLTVDGEWYMQISTEDNPEGELRGQIENFIDATRTISFPLTVDAVEMGLNGAFEETLLATQRGQLVSGTPVLLINDDAQAEGTVIFDSELMRFEYDFTFTGLSGNATIAHIHAPALNTEMAGVLLDLSISIVNDPDEEGSGTLIGDKDRLLPDEIESALAGLWYLNIHTEENPAGEVRAQVNRAQATVINSIAVGFVEIQLDAAQNTIRYQIRFDDLSGELVSVEIRGPASETEISDLVIAETQSVVQDVSDGIANGVASGVSEVLAQDVFDMIAMGDFYVVVNSLANPITGELRGQVVDAQIAEIEVLPPQSFSTEVMLSVDQELNALDENSEIIDSLLDLNGTGVARIEYTASALPDSGVITWTIAFENLSSETTVAHFHGAAGPTTTAGVRVVLADMPFESPLVGAANISDAMAREAAAGLWYVNIHTLNNPATGEIRGQIEPLVEDVIVETDAPTMEPIEVVQQAGPIMLTEDAVLAGGVPLIDELGEAIGMATVTLFMNQTLSWEISYTGLLSSNVTMVTFNGPALATEIADPQVIVSDIDEIFLNPSSGISATPISDEMMTALLNEMWYLNIATLNNPDGELRGQIMGFQEVELVVDGETEAPVIDAQDNGSISKSFSLLAIIATLALSSILA